MIIQMFIQAAINLAGHSGFENDSRPGDYRVTLELKVDACLLNKAQQSKHES